MPDGKGILMPEKYNRNYTLTVFFGDTASCKNQDT
jgi:hypothetical protein